MLFTADHDKPRRTLQKFITAEINPHVDEWEEAGIFPAHELFKKLGSLGFLGLNKPVEYGGQGLDYSYALMMAEELASIKTQARTDGDDYVINGGKMWITNGVQADFICLLANTSDGPVHRNKSLICVPMKSRGVQVARKLDKMGMRSSDTAQIFFDNVRVPKRNRIGEEGKGFTYQMIQFQEERLWGAAACLKAHEFIIAETIEYTRGRKAFGKSILDN